MTSPSPSMDEAATKEELRPVKKQLVSFWEIKLYRGYLLISLALQKQLKLSGGDMPRDDKVAILKDSLAAIGRRIDLVLENKRSAGEDVERWRRHLWTYVFFIVCFYQQLTAFIFVRFVTLFWPKQVKAGKLEEIHAKMVMKEGAPRAGSSSIKQPRPSGSIKSNGGLPTPAPSSSHRLNGGSKPHR